MVSRSLTLAPLPSLRAAAAAGGDGEAAGAAGDVLPGGAHGASLRELHELNAEMDAELDALMVNYNP